MTKQGGAMSENAKLIIGCIAAVFGVLLFVALATGLEVWFKRDVLGVPYCISGSGR